MKFKLLTGLLLTSVSTGSMAQAPNLITGQLFASMPSEVQTEARKAISAETETPGLAIDQQAPNFELSDQYGQQQSLGDLLKAGPVALVFYRSADW